MIECAAFGDVDGAVVRAYRLRGGGPLELSVITYGAHLIEVRVPDRFGVAANVVLRLPDLDAYRDPDRNHHMGSTVGRWANRIAEARFHLDGVEHHLARNDGPHCLHGGPEGFHRAIWADEAGMDATAAVLRLTHRSPADDQGFPGQLDVAVTYRVEDHRFTIDYAATTDRPTVVNLTNHSYWNLAGAGTVEDHELTVHARSFLPVDSTGIPLGSVQPLAGSPLDLTDGRRLGERVVDHCLLLDGSTPAVRLRDPRSGRVLELTTDQPGLQLYTGERRGVCLEAQRPPDAPNQPGLGPAVLRPGETYTQRTVHVFPHLADLA
jgi:aldose 1-epimerase